MIHLCTAESAMMLQNTGTFGMVQWPDYDFAVGFNFDVGRESIAVVTNHTHPLCLN